MSCGKKQCINSPAAWVARFQGGAPPVGCADHPNVTTTAALIIAAFLNALGHGLLRAIYEVLHTPEQPMYVTLNAAALLMQIKRLLS
jgi:hypothetical protein